MFCLRLAVALLGLVLLWPSSATASDCQAVYGKGRISLRVATGSPGELGLVAALAQAYIQRHGGAVGWRKAGSGAALRLLKARQVDLALVHAPRAEQEALAQGWAQKRLALGSNQFFIVGPKADPAGVAGAANAADAYGRIARARARFVSRGDKSGTHKKEMAIWQKAGLRPQGAWYLVSRQFMMASLIMAAKEGAYFMTDSSTWYVARAGRKVDGLKVLFQGDPLLVNHYHALTLPPGASPGAAAGARFAEFIASPTGQAIIAGFGRQPYGHPLYQPARAAGPPAR